MWKDAGKKQQAATALRYTAVDVKRMGCVDDVVREPAGGTQNDVPTAMEWVDAALQKHLVELQGMSVDALLDARYAKFRSIAQFYTTA